MNDKKTIGAVECIDLPEINVTKVLARVDSGAKTCAIWAEYVEVIDGVLHVIFWGKGSPYYSGKVHTFTVFDDTIVASSNGAVQHRYKVKILTKIGGKRIRASYTLADRSQQSYSVLLGRNILRKKFIVDVSKGNADVVAEKKRTEILRQQIAKEVGQ